MRRIINKDQFFDIMENELLKHFSVKDSVEILEDYQMFYKEKEEQGIKESEVLLSMEEPQDIINALIYEGVETTTRLSNILVSNGMRIALGIVWIGVSVFFLILTEFVNVTHETGIVLLILQIFGFWLVFSYRKFVLSKFRLIENKSRIFILLIILMIIVTYGCILMMYRFCIGPETAPILSWFLPSQIGPLVHYIIMFSIVVCLLGIYFVYYKYQRVLIQALVTFIGASSIFILIGLHARLANLENMETFSFFVKNQLITYTVIIIIGNCLFIAYNRGSVKEKMP